MGQLRRSAGVPRRRAGRLPQISRDLAKAGIRFLQAVNEAKHLVGDAAAAWVDSPSAENFFAQVDGAIDRMDPMLVEFSLFVLENFGPEQAGYLYGMILYEVAETAVITTVTVGAGAVVKAGLLPKFVNRVMKLPFVADNPKIAVKIDDFWRQLREGLEWVHYDEGGAIRLPFSSNELVTASPSKLLDLTGPSVGFTKDTYTRSLGFVYVLRDTGTGEILKVGKTTGGVNVYGRFDMYRRKSQQCGFTIEVEFWEVETASEALALERQMRVQLKVEGHILRWDRAANLGRLDRGLPWELRRSSTRFE